MIRESRGSMGKRLWKLSQTHLTLLSIRDTTGAWVQQNAIKNLKNGLFGVKFDGESAELWCSKAQGESFFQTRCDFGSFRDQNWGAVFSEIQRIMISLRFWWNESDLKRLLLSHDIFKPSLRMMVNPFTHHLLSCEHQFRDAALWLVSWGTPRHPLNNTTN